MTGALIEPNLHAFLIHIPVTLILIGVLMEVFHLLWHRSSAVAAGRWMIALGVLTAIPALASGLYALRQTVSPDAASGTIWADLANRAGGWTEPQWAVMERHIQMMGFGTLILLVAVVIWIACSDAARRYIYWMLLPLLLAGAGMIGYGTLLGSKLVYHYQTGVGLNVKTLADAVDDQGIGAFRTILQYIPQNEAHAILAGLTVALIAAALGLSIRRANSAWENRLAEEKAVAAGYRPAGQYTQKKNPLSIQLVYPGWFWVLAILAGGATLATGLWIAGVLHNPMQLLPKLAQSRLGDDWRPVLHGYLAPVVVLFCLILGLMLRFAPRRRSILSILSLLLVLTLFVQAWTGVLMLLDGPHGPFYRFNQPAANTPKSVITIPMAPPTTEPVDRATPVPSTHTLEMPTPANVPATTPSQE